MPETIQAVWALLKVLGVFGTVLSGVVVLYALKEGVVEAATGFGAIFFMFIFLGWDKFVGMQFMMSFMLAIVVGLVIAVIFWANR
jgi:hypothetical protein